MQRISEPQIVEAFTLSKTSPCPGRGVGRVRRSTLRLPGRNAARMLCSMVFANPNSGRGYLTIRVPEVLPGLSILPEKHLTLDQPTIAVDGADFMHFPLG